VLLPVAAIIAATVAPDDARSIVISRACLLSAWPAAIDDRTFDCVSDLRTAVLLLGERDIFVRTDLGLGIGVLFQVSAAPAAALPQSPSQPHSLRGRTQSLRHRGERSTAPIEHEGQSFLSNNIAFCRNRHSYQRFESHPFRHILLIYIYYLCRPPNDPRINPDFSRSLQRSNLALTRPCGPFGIFPYRPDEIGPR
jgi:hypothetical protein